MNTNNGQQKLITLYIEEKYQDHQLKGKLSKYRECHIQPDWLLVYLIEEDILVLTLINTGTHSDLFDE